MSRNIWESRSVLGVRICRLALYGYASGVMGRRLFSPNPDFDENAAKRWDAERFYSDPSYYLSKDLIDGPIVSVSPAGSANVGPSPTNSPKDPEHPAFANLSRTSGRSISGSTAFSSGMLTAPTSWPSS